MDPSHQQQHSMIDTNMYAPHPPQPAPVTIPQQPQSMHSNAAMQTAAFYSNSLPPTIQRDIVNKWNGQFANLDSAKTFKTHELPLARIKKIMKSDEDVKMISAEAPILFAKACEMFIVELTLRAWVHTEESKRRTLQRNDIATAISKTDIFDFLIDIVPREDGKPAKKEMGSRGTNNSAPTPATTADSFNTSQQYMMYIQQQAAQQAAAAGFAQPASDAQDTTTQEQQQQGVPVEQQQQVVATPLQQQQQHHHVAAAHHQQQQQQANAAEQFYQYQQQFASNATYNPHHHHHHEQQAHASNPNAVMYMQSLYNAAAANNQVYSQQQQQQQHVDPSNYDDGDDDEEDEDDE